jgi:hypothetical protein
MHGANAQAPDGFTFGNAEAVVDPVPKLVEI